MVIIQSEKIKNVNGLDAFTKKSKFESPRKILIK